MKQTVKTGGGRTGLWFLASLCLSIIAFVVILIVVPPLVKPFFEETGVSVSNGGQIASVDEKQNQGKTLGAGGGEKATEHSDEFRRRVQTARGDLLHSTVEVIGQANKWLELSQLSPEKKHLFKTSVENSLWRMKGAFLKLYPDVVRDHGAREMNCVVVSQKETLTISQDQATQDSTYNMDCSFNLSPEGEGILSIPVSFGVVPRDPRIIAQEADLKVELNGVRQEIMFWDTAAPTDLSLVTPGVALLHPLSAKPEESTAEYAVFMRYKGTSPTVRVTGQILQKFLIQTVSGELVDSAAERKLCQDFPDSCVETSIPLSLAAVDVKHFAKGIKNASIELNFPDTALFKGFFCDFGSAEPVNKNMCSGFTGPDITPQPLSPHAQVKKLSMSVSNLTPDSKVPVLRFLQ